MISSSWLLWAVTDGKHDIMTLNPVDTMSVNAASKNVDAAVELLKFIISSDVRDHFRADCYTTLVQMNASGASVSYDNESVAACMAEAGAHSRQNYVGKGASSFDDIVATNLQLMILGELTPAETVEAMETAINAVING